MSVWHLHKWMKQSKAKKDKINTVDILQLFYFDIDFRDICFTCDIARDLFKLIQIILLCAVTEKQLQMSLFFLCKIFWFLWNECVYQFLPDCQDEARRGRLQWHWLWVFPGRVCEGGPFDPSVFHRWQKSEHGDTRWGKNMHLKNNTVISSSIYLGLLNKDKRKETKKLCLVATQILEA